jgi:phosphodiesterase/alkaline phosphatase D-like protein
MYLLILSFAHADELAPRLPSAVTETSITSSSATVQWMLTDPYNPSRPETFIVSFGVTSGQLNMSIPGVTANPTSQTYSTQLSSLQPGTEYFYKITITNQLDSRYLSASFTTEDESKLNVMPILLSSINIRAKEVLLCRVRCCERSTDKIT